jgi:hypothetical protein
MADVCTTCAKYDEPVSDVYYNSSMLHANGDVAGLTMFEGRKLCYTDISLPRVCQILLLKRYISALRASVETCSKRMPGMTPAEVAEPVFSFVSRAEIPARVAYDLDDEHTTVLSVDDMTPHDVDSIMLHLGMTHRTDIRDAVVRDGRVAVSFLTIIRDSQRDLAIDIMLSDSRADTIATELQPFYKSDMPADFLPPTRVLVDMVEVDRAWDDIVQGQLLSGGDLEVQSRDAIPETMLYSYPDRQRLFGCAHSTLGEVEEFISRTSAAFASDGSRAFTLIDVFVATDEAVTELFDGVDEFDAFLPVGIEVTKYRMYRNVLRCAMTNVSLIPRLLWDESNNKFDNVFALIAR